MFKYDIIEDELQCYDYFRKNNISSYDDLRNSYKTNPIKNVTRTFAECVFSKYNAFQKEQKERKEWKGKGEYQIVVINDLHIPYHDSLAVRNVFNCIADIQPDELILNGDIIDCYWQSRFSKRPDKQIFIQDEADIFYRLFSSLRKHIPNTQITYVLGNHEDRIEKRSIEDPAFFGLKALDLKELLRLDDLGIRLEKKKYKTCDMLFVHGELCSKKSSYTAKAEFEAHKMVDGMSAHTHRLGFYPQSSEEDDVTEWVENGCLCTLDPDYIKGSVNWQHGFSIIQFFEDSFQVNKILIRKHKFKWNGVIYK